MGERDNSFGEVLGRKHPAKNERMFLEKGNLVRNLGTPGITTHAKPKSTC